jgi:thiopurine S-methyltransferase
VPIKNTSQKRQYMEKQFWHEKWEANDLGFHQDAPHPLLEKHFPGLGLAKGKRVFVPLCGKSSDMICLQAMGYEVLGLELSEVAAHSFFSENKLEVSISDEGAYKRFQSSHIEILCGDFFSTTRELLDSVSAVFDRAAIIAMPPEMREQYANKMRDLLNPGVEILLITLEYEQGIINPPPFAVSQQEVNRLFDPWCNIELLEKAAAEVKGKPCFELAYWLKVN